MQFYSDVFYFGEIYTDINIQRTNCDECALTITICFYTEYSADRFRDSPNEEFCTLSQVVSVCKSVLVQLSS